MAEIPKWKEEIAEQVNSILLDYPHSIALLRERAAEICAAKQRYLDAREKVDPAEITDEESDSLTSGSNTWPDKDETAVKNIPPDPIRGGEYSKRPATKEEKFREQCAALAVLHDSILQKELQESQVILTDRSLACLLVKKEVITSDAKYDRKFYEGALEAVEADLASTNKNDFTDTESNMLEALGDHTMHGPELLKRAGYDNSSHYRAILSGLVKRDILDRNARGYHRKSVPCQ